MAGLTEKEIKEIQEEIENCQNPLFFYDDDADGLCSFLILSRFAKKGSGSVVKSVPKLDESFLHRIIEHNPDKIFILDIAVVEQEFVDKAGCKVIWIDHHEPIKLHNVKVFNPRHHGPSVPTTYMAYQIAQQDLWLAALGCVADWFVPPFIGKFREEYPDLVSEKSQTAPDIIYNDPLGKIIMMINFILKGKTSAVNKSIRQMFQIKSPYEILNQETKNGRELFQRGEKIKREYDEIFQKAAKCASDDKIFFFNYTELDTSFTSELSNELIYRFPDKTIIIAREKNDEMRMSIRSTKKVIPPFLHKALSGLEGYGGGHEHACGASVKKKDFEIFMTRFRELV